jgi:hypothetical protein
MNGAGPDLDAIMKSILGRLIERGLNRALIAGRTHAACTLLEISEVWLVLFSCGVFYIHVLQRMSP